MASCSRATTSSTCSGTAASPRRTAPPSLTSCCRCPRRCRRRRRRQRRLRLCLLVLAPSVASSWATTARYHPGTARLTLGRQVLDASLSLGRRLSETSLATLAARLSLRRGSIVVVITAPNILVDGFCLSHCGLHALATSAAAATTVAPAATRERGRFAYAWVRNAADIAGWLQAAATGVTGRGSH
uniref:Uncharacterized protein n=1 Tax=Oryza meridionalis TaxID=40149 RepID=A0A0E0CCD4_9ORYZ